MKSVAIHQKDDWYLVKLPGYSDIPRKRIIVDVSLSAEEVAKSDYKSLRGAAIMERHLEKLAKLHEAIRNKSKKSNAERAEVLAIRKKFPELKALDEITRGLTVNDTNEELLDEYFTERARDEGLI
jgi:hypothetical protein